jgi:3'-5' exoribonuclease
MTKDVLKQISNFKANETVAAVLIIREMSVRLTRDGKPYLDVVLGDMSGVINGKVWDRGKEIAENLKVGMPVGVRALCEEYQGSAQLIISSLKPLNAHDLEQLNISWENLYPVTPKDRSIMWDSIRTAIDGLTDEWLKKLVKQIFADNEKKIKSHPASLKLHHAYIGGFLEHTYNMLVLAESAAQLYHVDRDLLISGILLHDIGKLEELNGYPDNFYTDKGNLLGHTVQGFSLVRDTIRKIPGFPDILAGKIEHIILSHQGEYEYQAPKKPAFIEALLVHYIDETDARMNMMKQIVNDDLSEGIWTSNRNYFKIPLLKEICDNE